MNDADKTILTDNYRNPSNMHNSPFMEADIFACSRQKTRIFKIKNKLQVNKRWYQIMFFKLIKNFCANIVLHTSTVYR